MIIKVLTENLYDAYSQFLLEHPNSLFYHTIKYKTFLETLLGCSSNYLLLCDNDDSIQGVLPLMWVDGKYGKVMNSLPFYGSNGSMLVTKSEYQTLLIEAYDQYIEEENIVASTVISNPLDDKLKVLNCNFKDERVGQWTKIRQINEDSLMEKIDSSTRRNIRKAIKQDIQVSI